jgi:hypothetical protein
LWFIFLFQCNKHVKCLMYFCKFCSIAVFILFSVFF